MLLPMKCTCLVHSKHLIICSIIVLSYCKCVLFSYMCHSITVFFVTHKLPDENLDVFWWVVCCSNKELFAYQSTTDSAFLPQSDRHTDERQLSKWFQCLRNLSYIVIFSLSKLWFNAPYDDLINELINSLEM